MDWLKGMNSVLEYIEENLTQPISYEVLSKTVGCSVYEFSRIFSFMAGMSVSEYIRRRRLSQSVFDIQNGREKIIDIALKYCYESPTAFSRAFKEIHGIAPLAAQRDCVSLKTYPKITFVLTIKGVDEMNFRIEKKDSFQIMGLSGYTSHDDEWNDSLWGNLLTVEMVRMAAELLIKRLGMMEIKAITRRLSGKLVHMIFSQLAAKHQRLSVLSTKAQNQISKGYP